VLRDFACRKFLLWVASKLPIWETSKWLHIKSTVEVFSLIDGCDQYHGLWLHIISTVYILGDQTTQIISRLRISWVPTTLTFDFSSSQVSEMLISHNMSFGSNDLDHFATSHIAISYDSHLWLLQLTIQQNVDLSPHALWIQWPRSFRDFVFLRVGGWLLPIILFAVILNLMAASPSCSNLVAEV